MLASLQGTPASQMQLWAPQSPGIVGKEVFLSHVGTGESKGMIFTGGDKSKSCENSTRRQRLCAKDGEYM